MSWIWMFLVAAAAEPEAEPVCPEIGLPEVIASAQAMEEAFWQLETERFEAYRERLRTTVSCVSEEASVADAIWLHRVHALDAFVEGDLEAVRRSFGAVKVLDPNWLPSAPPGHPLWPLFHDGPFQTSLTTLVDDSDADWLVDGTRVVPPEDGEAAVAVPDNRAFVLQVRDPKKKLVYTGYHVMPGDVPVDSLLALARPPSITSRRKSARTWGTVVSGALLAASAVTLGLGIAERSQLLNDPTIPPGELEDYQTRANRYGWASAGLAGAGVTTFAVAWGVRW